MYCFVAYPPYLYSDRLSSPVSNIRPCLVPSIEPHGARWLSRQSHMHELKLLSSAPSVIALNANDVKV